MNDLKIPNLNNKSKQYLFKNKIPLTRKPKIKLIKESSTMLAIAGLLLSISYAIPEKVNLFNSFISNLNNIIVNCIKIIGYLYEIIIVLFILGSLFFSIILITGALYRIYKIIKRKTKKINF
tara:strand:+ start:15456 stop:15821 length:366 start_codon:yes stop_codon:yes gene_type:complete